MVYTLQLENECYYIGWSKYWESLGYRLNSHFPGQGAAWTRLHSPQRVLEAVPGNKRLGGEITLKLAHQHTWEKVRGTAWYQVNLKSRPGQLDDFTAALARSKHTTIKGRIEDARDSMNLASEKLSGLMDIILKDGPPAEDVGDVADAFDQDDPPVVPRDYDASVP